MKQWISICLFILTILSYSCKHDDVIEGVYYVNSNKSDKVYIDKIERKTFRIYTPGTWNEIAKRKGNRLEGTWKYPDEYYNPREAGL